MIKNQRYKEVYRYLAARTPRETSVRKSDLARLLEIESSFCIFSDYRNGATTLMNDLAGKKDGIYIDSMSFMQERK